MQISLQKQEEFYQALLRKDVTYEGLFFVGVLSTSIFCRPTCPAKKPLRKNCLFFTAVEQALLAGFRPCKRCHPLTHQKVHSPLIHKLVGCVEQVPEKRWSSQDLREMGVDPCTARRHFLKSFGITFFAYARARRMGIALREIRAGKSVIEAQVGVGYESGSGFRDAFSKILGAPPSGRNGEASVLYGDWIETPLGPMLAISDDEALHLLEFTGRRGLEKEIERLRMRAKAAIIPEKTAVHRQVAKELKEYFEGNRQAFEIPLHVWGTPFQRRVWQALQEIPYGETLSYTQQAEKLGEAAACRAVANANGANQIAILIPCHRVIRSDGSLGGYGGGISKKEWLLQHEKQKNKL